MVELKFEFTRTNAVEKIRRHNVATTTAAADLATGLHWATKTVLDEEAPAEQFSK